MRNKIRSIRNHVSRHRFAYGVATGASAVGYLAYKRGQEWNEFLIEHGVYDAYYETLES